MNALIPFSASDRLRRAILFFLLLMLGNFTAQAQNNWTGNANNRDWNTAGNWSGGRVPLATDDAVIPSAPVNQPVLNTVAVAKSVEVQTGASLSIASAGVLVINGFKTVGGNTAAFYNRGTVNNSGLLLIGNSATANVGESGILNQGGTFLNNTGGSIAIDRTTDVGLFIASGSFTNAATIAIGAVASVGEYGIWNDGTFLNDVGGRITIDQTTDAGLVNSGGNSAIFTNSATIIIGVGGNGIKNSSLFQNAGCGALINVLANAVINGVGTFSNTGTIIENASGNSSITTNGGVVQNLNGGTFTIGTNTGVLTTSPGPLPTITAIPSLTITQGQSTTLTASGATSYSWSTGETTPAITVSAAGPYSVTGTTGGCSSTATVSMTVKLVPTFTVSNPAICSGQYVNLGNSIGNKSPNNGDLTYYTTQADAQAGTNALISSLVGPVNTPTTYYARYDAEGSFSIQSIMVTLKPALPAPPVLTQNGHAYTGGVSSVSVAQNSENVILAVPGCDGTVAWSGPNNFISFNSTISVPTSTTGSFTYSASCSSQTACFNGSSQATVTVSAVAPSCGTVVYVTQNGAGLQNGSSWTNAFSGTALQTAINTAAGCGAQVWVARGLYKPTTTMDRTISFSMKKGVAIYGGFSGNGTETMVSQRNWTTNPTILSGDIDGTPDVITGSGSTLSITGNGGNSYHVIYNNTNGLRADARLDGFTITGGNANGSDFPNNSGGGMYGSMVSPTVTNCVFTGNTAATNGGGMYHAGYYNRSNNETPSGVVYMKVTNCTFSTNKATSGGGLYMYVSINMTLDNVVFSKNAATGSNGIGGGGVFLSDSRPTLSNVVFSENAAERWGGAISTFGTNAYIANGTFSNNTVAGTAPEDAGGISFSNDIVTSLYLLNCVFWNNRIGNNTIKSLGRDVNRIYAVNCDFQDLSSLTALNKTNCIDQDPQFVDANDPDGPDNQWMTADDGLSVRSTSPVVNSGVGSTQTVGNNTNTLNAPSTDIVGNPRPYMNTAVDMGAYEFQGSTSLTLASSASPNPVCAGATTALSVTASGGTSGMPDQPYSYTWVAPAGITLSATSTSAVSASIGTGLSGPQTFTITVAASGGSPTSTSLVSLVVNATPTVNITANPSLTIIQGQSTILTASGATTYQWSTTETINPITVSPRTTVPYSVRGTTNGCSSVTTVTVTVNAPGCGAGLSGPTWTGCVSTDWNTAGNWASGVVPTATDDVVIPSAPANQPVLSTAAVAKSVEVLSGASLSISSTGSLTINGSKDLGRISGGITAFYNAGTVNNSGQVVIGNLSTASVGQLGINNLGTFVNNTGGSIAIDRTSVIGIRNISGSFTNSATITVGAVAAVGQFGIENGNSNSATFQNNTGGSITIDRTTDTGLFNSRGTFTNSATLTIGAVAAVGTFGIINDGNFQNTGCGALINIVADAFIVNSRGTFSNTGTIIENATGNSNISSNAGLVQNLNGGTFTITGTNTGLVTTIPGSLPTITATPSLTINQGNSTTLTASGALNYSWSTGETTPAISVSVAGPYSVTGTIGSCSSVTTVTLTVNGLICGAGLSGPTWTGCVNTDWNTAGNWASGAVPVATDDVVIPSAPANQPVLSTAAVAKSVEVQTGASLSISSAGSLTINGSKNVDGFTTAFSNRGMLQNAGLLILGNTADVGAFAIWNRSSFTNNGGEIRIDRTTNQGINNNVGLFTNTGTITIGALASVGQQGILNQAAFANTGGTITIDRTTSDGLLNTGTFVNSATITIGRSASSGEAGLTNSGSFTNATGGRIQIDRSTLRGLFNQGGNFTNSAMLIIGATEAVGSSGLYNLATFANQAGGRIQLDNSTGSGVYNSGNGRFTNSAMLIIGATAAVGLYGIYNRATFENQAGGYIQLDNSTYTSLYNQNDGTFINSATITIGSLGTIGGTGIRNEGPFANSACATLTVLAPIINYNNSPSNINSFSNAGLITVNTAQAHTNTRTLTNNGIISYPQGNPIPNVTNNDVIVAPLNSCSVSFSQALQLGASNNQFTVGANWYKDQDLTQPAGTYNQATNTFTATNLAPGSSTLLYFAATDNTNNCTKTVAVSVTVNQSVTASIIPSAMTVCAGTPVSLTASGAVGAGTSWQWNTGAITQVITVATNGPSGATGIPGSPTGPAGPYSVTVTTAAGCSASAIIALTVNPVPVASISPSSLTVCQGQPASLTASGGSDYLWSTGETTAVINVTATGTYSVTVSGRAETGPTGATGVSGGRLAAVSGCSSTTSIMVTINALPAAGLVSSGTLTCAQTSVTLTASGGITGETFSYTFTNGSGTVLGIPGAGNTLVVSNPGMYSVRVANASGCSSVTSTSVISATAVPVAVINPASATLTCASPSVSLTASGGSTYRWDDNSTNDIRTVNASGTYSVTLVSANGCSSVASTSVSQDNSVPAVSISPASATITQGQTTTLTATSPTPLTSYAWSTSQTTPTISVSTAATYSLTVTATNGCSATASATVSVTMAPVVTASFAITGVTTVDCTPVLPDRYSISFTPRYAGLTGQPITFSITNELLPTTAAGPYSLQLYTDNPILLLKATQAGTASQSVSFSYNWLDACRASVSANTPPRVMMSLPPQSATVGVGFSYVIPAGTFTDDQTPGSLLLTASGLPAGLSLSGYTISGTPSNTAGSPFSVSITATDPGRLSVSTSFVLTVSPGPATPPVSSGVFSITGVSLLRCTPVADRINISFAPQYAGLNGQAIAFRVVNELAPTNDPAPYSLTLYRDNPVIRLRATQTGSVGEASFDYNWLVACASIGADNTAPRVVNPVGSQTATVGAGYSLNLSNVFADQETPNGIVLSASGLPAGLTLTGTAISGTPSVTGVSTVVLTATDPGNLSVSTSFLLTVSPAASVTAPSGGFNITGVQTVSCVAVSASLRRVTFTPQYSGLTGQPISFRVVNELAPTSMPGPYSLNLYTDNPVISLRATQTGTPGEVSYSYNWLGACNTGSRIGAEPVDGLIVTVLGNPVIAESVTVEVRGAAGERLQLDVLDSQGKFVRSTVLEQAAVVDRVDLRLGSLAGVYLLRVSSPTHRQTLKLVKP